MRTTSEHRPLLLDTHVWIWLVQGDATLPPVARDTIRAAAALGTLRIAAITLWEIGMLASRRRVELGNTTTLWLQNAVARSRARIEPLTAHIGAASCELPGTFRSDPADQMIVATARITGALLMTRDRRILDYAAAGHLNTIAV